MKCYSLLYIEYPKYFVGAFNHIQVFDLTSSGKKPQKVFKPREEIFDLLAYLDRSRVLIFGTSKVSGIYGYSLTGTELYHIETIEARHLVSFKASDYFAVFLKLRSDSRFVIYNLRGRIYSGEVDFYYDELIVYSVAFGGLLLLNSNILLQYSWSQETANPSCDRSVNVLYSFTNKACRKNCAEGAVYTARGFCEFYREEEQDFLKYFDSSLGQLPVDPVTNIKTGVICKIVPLKKNGKGIFETIVTLIFALIFYAFFCVGGYCLIWGKKKGRRTPTSRPAAHAQDENRQVSSTPPQGPRETTHLTIIAYRHGALPPMKNPYTPDE